MIIQIKKTMALKSDRPCLIHGPGYLLALDAEELGFPNCSLVLF